MKYRHYLTCAAVCAALVIPPFFAAQDRPHSVAPSATGKSQRVAQQPVMPPDEGEKIFQQNCARCHAAPEGFSPRISGTIVRHMRVRGNLSEHDERALLHFLNP